MELVVLGIPAVPLGRVGGRGAGSRRRLPAALEPGCGIGRNMALLHPLLVEEPLLQLGCAHAGVAAAQPRGRGGRWADAAVRMDSQRHNGETHLFEKTYYMVIRIRGVNRRCRGSTFTQDRLVRSRRSNGAGAGGSAAVAPNPLGMIVIKKLFVVLPKNRQRIDFSWALSLPVLSTCSCSDGPFTPQVCFAGLKWSMVLLHKKRQNLQIQGTCR